MYKISDTTTAIMNAITAAFTDPDTEVVSVKVVRGDPARMKILNLGVPYIVVQEKNWTPNTAELGAMARSIHECSFVLHVLVYSRDPDEGHAGRIGLVEGLVELIRTDPSIGGAVDYTDITGADLDVEFPGENDTGYAGTVEIETRKLAL